uniref:Uncharacterized protein n=1 Tax=Romanomermis culicivorax TaxID=13658 RepID=A0A915J6P0_ROMCU
MSTGPGTLCISVARVTAESTPGDCSFGGHLAIENPTFIPMVSSKAVHDFLKRKSYVSLTELIGDDIRTAAGVAPPASSSEKSDHGGLWIKASINRDNYKVPLKSQASKE